MNKFKFTIFLATLAFANIVCADVPYCTANQLSIYNIAGYQPGMMHLGALYGIINHSKQACQLKSDNNSARFALQVKDNSVIVEPLTNPDFINSDKLVWFYVRGTQADVTIHDAQGNAIDNPDHALVQNGTLAISLPGISHNYKVEISKDYNQIDNTPTIQKNLIDWEVTSRDDDACDDKNFGKGKVWKVYFKNEVECG